MVEQGAGIGAGYPDPEYEHAGAKFWRRTPPFLNRPV